MADHPGSHGIIKVPDAPKTGTLEGDVARENWYRYAYCRDNGHREFVEKARRCEDFFAGLQWDQADLDKLRASNRPALTINKILSTIDHMVGEQLFNRSSIAYRAARGMATNGVADALTKVFMNISQANSLPYIRTDVFTDGIITGRGFYDARLNLNTNFMGDAVVKRAMPETVLLDPDAEDYDPKNWADATVSRWVSLSEIELLWGPEKAEQLGAFPASYMPYDFGGDDFARDGTFGTGGIAARTHNLGGAYSPYGAPKYFRIVDRQYYRLEKIQVFVDMKLGEIRPIPEAWDHNRISFYLQNNPQVFIMNKPAKKIRWSVTSGHVTLHDSWSPYQHFTIIPFFPRLRNGRTIGVVEHLIGPQQILNKARSQELHILNTSANSGWVLEHNNLVNMTETELEGKGSETGVVLVVKDIKGLEKIKPNQIPTGLDRVAFKSEEDLKNISGISDYQTGFAREDVSAKAVKANQAVGGTSFAPLLNNLTRSDSLLATVVLSLVQTYYVEPRLLHIIGLQPGQENSTIEVNQVDPRSGEILNNLTLGEYEVVVTSEPERDTFEDSQYDQAVEMRRELNIPIPDSFIIRTSKLRDKEELLGLMNDSTPEEDEFNKQVEQRTAAAELRKLEGEASEKEADATLKAVRAAKERQEMQKPPEGQMTQEQLGQAKVKMLENQQTSNNKIREANHEFMLDIKRMQEQARVDILVAKATPKPPAIGASTP